MPKRQLIARRARGANGILRHIHQNAAIRMTVDSP